jgi:hypothetical protein
VVGCSTRAEHSEAIERDALGGGRKVGGEALGLETFAMASGGLYEANEPVKTRTFEIRRLALSEILDEGFAIFRLGFARFILFQLILYVPSTGALAFIFNEGGNMLIEMLRTGVLPPIEALIAKATLAFAALFLIQTVVASISSVALTRGVADTYLSRPWTVASILKEAMRLTPRATVTGVLIGLLVVACFLLPLAGMAVIGVVAGARIYAALGLAVVILLGLVALAIAFLSLLAVTFVFLRYSLAPTALAIEDLSVGRAFERAVALMKGRYLSALGLLVVLTMLSALLGGVLSAFVPSPSFEGKDVDEIRRLLPQLIRAQILSAIFGQAIGVLTHTYSLICWTLFYFSTRCEKEGFDLVYLASRVAERDPAKDAALSI